MTDNHAQQAAKPKTLLGKIISLPLTLFGLLCGSLLLSILIECVGIYFLWPQQGHYHAQQMFYTELEQLSTNFTQSMLISNPAQVSMKILEFLYEWLFVKSGLVEQVSTALTPQVTESDTKLTFRHTLNLVVDEMQTYLLAAGYTTLTFFVRLIVLLLCSPLIAMSIFVGFVDGLVKRDIRRFVAQHESSFVYHRAKAFLIPAITLPWVIYLALPFSVSPLLIMVPCALLAGVVMNMTVASFKKYL